MIFVTIGSQEPFDRLLKTVDDLAPEFENKEFVAQKIGTGYTATNIQTLDFIPPEKFKGYIEKADLIISHAGIGTILSALQLQKPIIVFPRLAKFRETRDDHQLATALAYEKLGYLHVAVTREELHGKLNLFFAGKMPKPPLIAPAASEPLLLSLKKFIDKNLSIVHGVLQGFLFAFE